MEYSLLDLSDLTTFCAYFPSSFFMSDENKITRYYVIGHKDQKTISFFSVGMMTSTSVMENYYSLDNGIPISGTTRILNEEGELDFLIDKDMFEDEFNSDVDFIFCWSSLQKYDVVNEHQVFYLSEL
jgi:hypothetical protein